MNKVLNNVLEIKVGKQLDTKNRNALILYFYVMLVENRLAIYFLFSRGD